ncbi:MAG: hypothetical protein F4X18_01145 [Acidimicrobiia bacterium]|nr:hypothetical protein [Acidimicrobiia bacterium]
MTNRAVVVALALVVAACGDTAIDPSTTTTIAQAPATTVATTAASAPTEASTTTEAAAPTTVAFNDNGSTTTTTTTTVPTTTTEAVTTTTAPATTTTEAVGLGVVIAPEDCEGYERDHYRPHGTSWRELGGVGYLTGEALDGGDVDHVVGLEEGWCSGIREPAFGSAGENHRASVSSVNRGKGGRDPAEWWDTSGRTTPRTNDYPGWCEYLRIHVAVKVAWAGTMDQAEHDFISDQLADC